MRIGLGSLVVYTPPGTTIKHPYPDGNRLIVVSVPDADGYVWCCDVVQSCDTKPDLTAEYVGDLTQLA